MYRIVLLAALFTLGACSQVTPPGAGEADKLQLTADDGKGDGRYVAVNQKLEAVFVSGDTTSALDGPYKGLTDVFLRRYNRNGTLAWRTQIGGTAYDWASGVGSDKNGNVYVATTKCHPSGTCLGNLYKYSGWGAQLWVRRFNAPSGIGTYVGGLAVASDGKVYVAGHVLDGGPRLFLRVYAASGDLLTNTSFPGTDAGEGVFSVAVDANGNAYLATSFFRDEVYYESVLYKVSPGGKKLWAYSTPGDTVIRDLQVAGGMLWAAGEKNYYSYLNGQPSYRGDRDIYVARFGFDGALKWSRSFGTPRAEGAANVFVDAGGNAYVSGVTEGPLNAPSSGSQDLFLRKYASSGDLVFTKQFGTAGFDVSDDFVGYGVDEFYLTGYTDGTFANGTYNTGVLTMRLDGSGRTVWLDQ